MFGTSVIKIPPNAKPRRTIAVCKGVSWKASRANIPIVRIMAPGTINLRLPRLTAIKPTIGPRTTNNKACGNWSNPTLAVLIPNPYGSGVWPKVGIVVKIKYWIIPSIRKVILAIKTILPNANFRLTRGILLLFSIIKNAASEATAITKNVQNFVAPSAPIPKNVKVSMKDEIVRTRVISPGMSTSSVNFCFLTLPFEAPFALLLTVGVPMLGINFQSRNNKIREKGIAERNTPSQPPIATTTAPNTSPTALPTWYIDKITPWAIGIFFTPKTSLAILILTGTSATAIPCNILSAIRE